MHVVIIANRNMRPSPLEHTLIQDADLIIAADGGADQCRSLGLTPALIIGDLDSIADATRIHFTSKQVDFEKHPKQKDQTDLELALDAALAKGAQEISVLCALGGRWDMSLANALMLLSDRFRTVTVRMIDGGQEVLPIRGGECIRLEGTIGQRVSLIPVGRAEGIALSGLAYPLHDESLPPGSARGVSNHFTAASATIRLSKGMLLCVIDRDRQQE